SHVIYQYFVVMFCLYWGMLIKILYFYFAGCLFSSKIHYGEFYYIVITFCDYLMEAAVFAVGD
ncbi:hypothetical protein, partial [Salmonella enterica]|uniref:hypothetical protein n=1 Tax=Salmonella enterica TaxID=28901 RepID=UPI0032990064